VKHTWLLLLSCACGGTTSPPPERAEPLASATPSASASTPNVTQAATGRRVVFGPDLPGPFTSVPRPLATAVGPRGLVQLVGTTGRLCALRQSGEVWCIDEGQAWKPVVGISDAAHLAIGHDLSCAVRKSGAVTCWGYVNEAWGFHPTPTDVPHVSGAVRTVTALASACFLGQSGHVTCVGMGSGVGRPIDRTFDPVEPLDLGESADLFSGAFETCARTKTGTVSCWGVAEHGVFGPFAETTKGPIELAGIRGATYLTFTQAFACAVLADGGMACWGDHPGLNDDDPRGPYNFQRIFGLTDAVSVVPQSGSLCVLRRNGQVVCFGMNHEGQLGEGTENKGRFGPTDDTIIPVLPEDVRTSVAGRGAATTPHLLKRSSSGPRSTRLVNVVGLTDAVDLANDGFATCALRKTGSIVCWGSHIPATKIDRTSTPRAIPSPP
jgi:alpha-tubulin suppressor-like RCC1 family protein